MSLLPKALKSPLPQGHVRMDIPGSTAGTARTIKEMQKLVTHGKRDFRIRKLVGRLIADCPHKDYECYARRCYEFCRDQIQYAYDPVNVELIEAPHKILESGVADCDSICVLLASMVENIGLPAEYVTIKADPNTPGEYSHVYTRARIPGKGGKMAEWRGMDATMAQFDFGWEPPQHLPRKRWPASLDSQTLERDADMMGLADLGRRRGSRPARPQRPRRPGRGCPPCPPQMPCPPQQPCPACPPQDVAVPTPQVPMPAWHPPVGVRPPRPPIPKLLSLRGLSEGVIPGVVNAERDVRAPSQNYRLIEAPADSPGFPQGDGGRMLGSFSMDACCPGFAGLSGCSDNILCGPCTDGALGLRGMGQSAADILKATDPRVNVVLSVADGSLAKEIKSEEKEHDRNVKTLAQRRLEIAKMPDGQAKQAALQLWEAARNSSTESARSIFEAKQNHNEIAKTIQTISLEQVKPPQLSGMGALPLVPIAVVAGVLVAAGFAVNAVANAIAAAKGTTNATRGYLDQLAEVIKQGGGAITSTAELTKALTWAAVIGGGLYFGSQLLSRRGGGRRAPGRSLKIAQGRVL